MPIFPGMIPGMAMTWSASQRRKEEEKKRLEREAQYNVDKQPEFSPDKPKYNLLDPQGRAAYEESQKNYLKPEQVAGIIRKHNPKRYESYDDETLVRQVAARKPGYAQFLDPEWLARPQGARVYDEDYDATYVDAGKNMLHNFKSIPKQVKAFIPGIISGMSKFSEEYIGEPWARANMKHLFGYNDEELDQWERNVEIFKEGSAKAIDPLTGEVTSGIWKRNLSDIGVQYSEKLRKQGQEQIQSWIDSDYDLQAYMAWQTDKEWSSENFLSDPFDMMNRGISEFLPSIISTSIGAGLGALAGSGGGIPGMISGAGYGAMVMGTIMEGSSSYNEAMRYMVDEKGIAPEDAIGMATAVSSIYGIASGWLERFQLKTMGKVAGVSDDLFAKTFTRKALEYIITKAAKDPKNAGKLLAKEGIESAIRRIDWFTDGAKEGLQEATQAMTDQMTSNIYKKYAHDGKVDWDTALHNFGKDLFASATSKETKDSFFSAMVGSLGFGVHTRGPRTMLKYSKAALQSSAGQKVKKMMPGMPSMPSMPSFGKIAGDASEGRTSEEETIDKVPTIKNTSDYFRLIANENGLNDDNKIEGFGKHSSLITEETDESTAKFIKDKGTLQTGQIALELYQKGQQDNKDLSQKDLEKKIFSGLDKTGRTQIKGIIAQQFIENMSKKKDVSSKAKALFGEAGTVLEAETDDGVNAIFNLMFSANEGEKKAILAAIIKNKSLSELGKKGLTNNQLNKILNDEMDSLPEGIGQDLPSGAKVGENQDVSDAELGKSFANQFNKQGVGDGTGAVVALSAATKENPGAVKVALANLTPENLSALLKHKIFEGLVKRGEHLTKAGNLSKSNKTYDAIEKILQGYEGAPVKESAEIELDIGDSKKTEAPVTTKETGSLKEVESWLQANPGIKWSKRKTKAYKEQRKLLNQKAVEVGATVTDKMDNIKIKAAILKAAKKKFKGQPVISDPKIEAEKTVKNISEAIAGLKESLRMYDALDPEYDEIMDQIDSLKAEQDKNKNATANDNIKEERVIIGGIDATTFSPEVQAAMRIAMEDKTGDKILTEKDKEYKAAKKAEEEAKKNDGASVLSSMSQEVGQNVVAGKTDLNGNPAVNVKDQDATKNIKCGPKT